MSRGRFITLEGGEGAGKSTNARFIKAWLEQRGREVILTREPGGSPLAEAIRGVVLQSWAEGMPQQTEALLMFSARSAHLEATVLPALKSGKDVICDRFVDSSYAYQGAGNGFSIAKLRTLEEMVLGNLRPDLTIVFDLDPDIGLQRARSRGEQNRFEDETLAFMQRVRKAFLDRAEVQPARYAVLNAGQELEATQAALSKILESRL
jgi:dTMP kinase